MLKLPDLFFTALFFLTNPSLFPSKLSFCFLALKHTGHWDQPVALYINTRPRETIGKKGFLADFKKINRKRRGEGGLSHNLHSHGCFKCSPGKETFQPQDRWIFMNLLYCTEGLQSANPRMFYRLSEEGDTTDMLQTRGFLPASSSSTQHSLRRTDVHPELRLQIQLF